MYCKYCYEEVETEDSADGSVVTCAQCGHGLDPADWANREHRGLLRRPMATWELEAMVKVIEPDREDEPS